VAIAASWRRLLRELTTTLYHVILALLSKTQFRRVTTPSDISTIPRFKKV